MWKCYWHRKRICIILVEGKLTLDQTFKFWKDETFGLRTKHSGKSLATQESAVSGRDAWIVGIPLPLSDIYEQNKLRQVNRVMSDVSCLWSYEMRTLIDVLLSSCQENELNSPEGILGHQISLPSCCLGVIDIDNIRSASNVVVLLPC